MLITCATRLNELVPEQQLYVLPDVGTVLKRDWAAGVGLLLGGGGAQYALGRRRGLGGVLLSISVVPDESSLFLFLGRGFGFTATRLEESSDSSSRKGFVLTGAESAGISLSCMPSGLSRISGVSGPNI